MRKQRAFPALTEQKIEQLADWLHREPCETVLDRVNKPRPEGLNISKNPLQTFCAKVMLLDSIKVAPATRAAAPSNARTRPTTFRPSPIAHRTSHLAPRTSHLALACGRSPIFPPLHEQTTLR